MDEKTIVVLGTYGSGTSAVAGLLRILGIPMGSKFNAPNHEDLELQRATLSCLKSVIDKRNQEFSLWGWKDPYFLTSGTINQAISLIRNPHFICVFRGPYSTAIRQSSDTKTDLVQNLKIAVNNLNKLVEFVENYYSKFPILFISYEKLMLNKEENIRSIANFVGIDLSDTLLDECLKFISIPGYKYID